MIANAFSLLLASTSFPGNFYIVVNNARCLPTL